MPSEEGAHCKYYALNQGPAVSQVYPVDSAGTVLHDIRLYDQDGNPIVLGDDCPNVYSLSSNGQARQTIVQSADGSGTVQLTVVADAPTYPRSCPTDLGPFPSGRAPALPATPTPPLSGGPTSPSTPPTPPPTPTSPSTSPAAVTTPGPAPTPTR